MVPFNTTFQSLLRTCFVVPSFVCHSPLRNNQMGINEMLLCSLKPFSPGYNQANKSVRKEQSNKDNVGRGFGLSQNAKTSENVIMFACLTLFHSIHSLLTQFACLIRGLHYCTIKL